MAMLDAVQSMAQRTADDMKAIGQWGCLAACYGFVAEWPIGDCNSEQFLMRLCQARQEGIIDQECNVYDAVRFLNWWTGGQRRFAVAKVPIIDGDISHIVRPTPVRYLAEGHGGHWVVVADGRIVWNPLTSSYNVNHGIAVDSRVIKEVVSG